MRTNINEQFDSLRQQSQGANAAPETQSLQQSLLSFVASTELVELPSQGKFYPEGHPLKDKQHVEIRQMTAKEEDILTNKSFLKKGVVVDKLIESLLIDKTIDINSLLIGDKNAIMVAARSAAYGSKYELILTCQDCGDKKTHQVNLAEMQLLTFDKLYEGVMTDESVNAKKTDYGTVVVQLPKTGWFVELRPLNGGDERRMFTLIEAKKAKNIGDDITISEQLNFIIRSINTIEDRKVLQDAVNLMPASDAKHIRNVYQRLIPNVKIVTNFSCENCVTQQEVEVPFTQEFFWPK